MLIFVPKFLYEVILKPLIWFCDDARGLSDKYVWMKLSK